MTLVVPSLGEMEERIHIISITTIVPFIKRQKKEDKILKENVLQKVTESLHF